MKYNTYLAYHHEDREYADKYIELFGELLNIVSPKITRVDEESGEEYIERCIENSGISKSSIVVVLTGPKTYKRKHVDWDIYAGLKKKAALVGICLPNRNDYILNKFILETYPHRLEDNVKTGYASIHKWTENQDIMRNILASAQKRSQNTLLMKNSRRLMQKDHHFCGARGCECH